MIRAAALRAATAQQFTPAAWKTAPVSQPRVVLPRLQPTPLLPLAPQLFVKLEGAQEGGSIKDRAVTKCVFGMINAGTLKPGGTLALCTSGSAGVSLLRAQQLLQMSGIHINVKIFMPESYLPKDVPQRIASTAGITIERERPHLEQPRMLCPLEGDFVSTLVHMKALAAASGWAILDQHFDMNSMLAHESTASELLSQCPDLTDVVCTTGTGGTAAGLRKFLPKHISVHSRPAVSGTLDGCTDVRRYDNFCRAESLEGYDEAFFCPDEARVHQQRLLLEHGISCGPSSGAAFALAERLRRRKGWSIVAFISADGKPPVNMAPGNILSNDMPMKGFVMRSGSGL